MQGTWSRPTWREFRPNSGTDQQGRCYFFLLWPCNTAEGGVRGQCFHADPRSYGFPRPEELPAAGALQ